MNRILGGLYLRFSPSRSFLSDNLQANGWIGLNDRNEVDAWKWIDGRAVTMTNWYTGEASTGTQVEGHGW